MENKTIQNREGKKDPVPLAKTGEEAGSQMVVADMETNGDQVRSQPQHDEQKKAHLTAEVATTVRETSRNMQPGKKVVASQSRQLRKHK